METAYQALIADSHRPANHERALSEGVFPMRDRLDTGPGLIRRARS